MSDKLTDVQAPEPCGCYKDATTDHYCQRHWDELCTCPTCGQIFKDDPTLRVMHEDDEHARKPMTDDVQAQAPLATRIERWLQRWPQDRRECFYPHEECRCGTCELYSLLREAAAPVVPPVDPNLPVMTTAGTALEGAQGKPATGDPRLAATSDGLSPVKRCLDCGTIEAPGPGFCPKCCGPMQWNRQIAAAVVPPVDTRLALANAQKAIEFWNRMLSAANQRIEKLEAALRALGGPHDGGGQ